MAEVHTVPLGTLQPWNVVSTFMIAAESPSFQLSLPVSALALSGRYSERVFPAVSFAMRVQLERDVAGSPSVKQYPLQARISKAGQRAQSHVKKVEAEPTANGHLAANHLTATISEFKSGQHVIAGGITEAVNQMCIYLFTRRLSTVLKQCIRPYNIRTQNIVCSANLGFEVDLDWLYQTVDESGWSSFYNPEEFPGLSWDTREKGIKIVFVVFRTGKVVAAGMKSMEGILVAQERMQRLISPFRHAQAPSYVPRRIRDDATLTAIKTEVHLQEGQLAASAASATGGGVGQSTRGSGTARKTTRLNAAARNNKKMSSDVRQMMKSIARVVTSASAEEGDELVSSFQQLMREDDVDQAEMPVVWEEETR